MRAGTIRWIAAFAALSPQRESGCRVVLPEDAGIGTVPVRAANWASVARRSGLSPMVSSSWEATVAPTPLISSRAGACATTMAVISASTVSISALRKLCRPWLER